MADLTSEIGGIVFGQADPRLLYIDGFSDDSFEQRLQRPYVWGVGKGSEIRWPILRRRQATLQVELRPFHFSGAPPQTVDVSLNGNALQRLELKPGVTKYDLPIAADQQRLGSNSLRFQYGWHRSPSQVGGSRLDTRQLAVAFFTLGWKTASPAVGAKPQVDAASGRLFLPQGSHLDFYLRLEGNSRLTAEQWAFRGPSGRLRITLEEETNTADSPDERVVADLLQAPPAGWLQLPGQGRRLVRLSIESLAPEGSDQPLDSEQGILWTRPHIASFIGPTTESSAEPSVETQPEAPLQPADHSQNTSLNEPLDAQQPLAQQRLPHVILYMMDTLRADHLGAYGYHRPTSPHLDALASEALLFERAIAQSSWTRSSIASLFTGLWPLAHGTNLRQDVLSDDAFTLPERLQERGYRTAGFFSNPNISEIFGFRQGFDHLVDLGETDVDADVVHRHALQWIDGQNDDTPLFLYIHTVDPHSPYDPPAAFRRQMAPQVAEEVAWTASRLPRAVRRRRAEPTTEQMAEMIDLYDAEIAFGDAAFGEFRQALEKRQLFTDSWLVVLSDHGEEFLEHGYLEHGKNLFGESLNIPWILKPPGVPGRDFQPRRVAEPVQHIDLLPTLSRALGLIADGGWQGRDLSPLWSGTGEVAETTIYSYLHLDGEPRISLIDGPWKLIQRVSDDHLVEPRLFHLPSDPKEQHDLAKQHWLRQRFLSKQLQRRRNTPEGRLERSTTELDENLKRRLEALGYLN